MVRCSRFGSTASGLATSNASLPSSSSSSAGRRLRGSGVRRESLAPGEVLDALQVAEQVQVVDDPGSRIDAVEPSVPTSAPSLGCSWIVVRNIDAFPLGKRGSCSDDHEDDHRPAVSYSLACERTCRRRGSQAGCQLGCSEGGVSPRGAHLPVPRDETVVQHMAALLNSQAEAGQGLAVCGVESVVRIERVVEDQVDDLGRKRARPGGSSQEQEGRPASASARGTGPGKRLE